LDGTLIDTAPIHWQAWNEVLSPIGHPLTWEAFLPTFGLRNDTLIPLWVGEHIQAEEVQRIAEEKEARYREVLKTRPVPLMPGAEACLKAFQQRGCRQALATMTPRQNLELILQKVEIAGFLDTLVTAEDVPRGKPAPDVFLAAADKLQVAPEDCLVIEDSLMGVEAARRAGMRVIGVGDSIPPGEADIQVAGLENLLEMLVAQPGQDRAGT
jgi:beta-phosphoglucomutase